MFVNLKQLAPVVNTEIKRNHPQIGTFRVKGSIFNILTYSVLSIKMRGI